MKETSEEEGEVQSDHTASHSLSDCWSRDSDSRARTPPWPRGSWTGPGTRTWGCCPRRSRTPCPSCSGGSGRGLQVQRNAFGHHSPPAAQLSSGRPSAQRTVYNITVCSYHVFCKTRARKWEYVASLQTTLSFLCVFRPL